MPLGNKRCRRQAPPSVLPDISPSRGEIGSFGLIALFFIAENWRKPLLHPISPLEGEMSGRTEGGAVPPFL
ncbi:hypothetical protein EN925_35945 [Mesorhizobium sp. M7A.F.Ca.US.006.04.2.1]|nr:hypothetical protein EN965_35510 [Mesorhizobium sp. M7A.F.Ca.CA.001.05.1.1]RUY63176.1 hypothetical protein EN980_28740 [Mesorhizobium sp. M7A.F.Ca.CA.001.13.1.1]RUZ01083.1 hypothetical protein EN955_30400 [Mesorhizobium sp. M7A.F.Ca.CA.001.04.2.1]RUZ30563.1 hypothetical protein EN953_21435 [Mesorhizobium sp. M7A.F.Ca.CA.001.04.1.1]RUZ39872.1 hypothetical protein EN952_13145 [Mesorhizobium sp. M7A.F.Ca.CA.001.15.1.1]RUZ94675.1 hypothetical protein EN938_35445 [Mesorhizobium sp. M7A.F.Ca.US.0